MLALVFPGQGSQAVGMMAALGEAFPVVRDTFASVSEICGADLWQLACRGPAEELDRTVVTQPAMLAAGVATWRVWQGLGGPAPGVVAGHSLGEYCALVAAGSLSLRDAATLVNVRARAMQRAVPLGAGAMAAFLKLDDPQVEAICRDVPGIVEPANYNAPGQVVVGGEAAAVEAAMAAATRAGARVLPIKVSVPSHTSLMRGAATALADALAGVALKPPQIPVLHNVDVRTHPDVAGIRRALTEQLYRPVQWTSTSRALGERGVRRIAECGPGRVLVGLVRRVDRHIDARTLGEPEDLRRAIGAWKSAA